jgi:hypothetical protein
MSDVETHAPRLVSAIVAPGHTIMIDGSPNARAAGPGETVELPESEVEFHRQRGFLLDTDGRQRMPDENGPSWDNDQTRSDRQPYHDHAGQPLPTVTITGGEPSAVTVTRT